MTVQNRHSKPRGTSRAWVVLGVLAVLLGATNLGYAKQRPKIGRELMCDSASQMQLPPGLAKKYQKACSLNSTVNVIVQFKSDKEAQYDLIAMRFGGHKLKHQRRMRAIKSRVYAISAKQAKALADDSNVRYISPDRPVKASLDTVTPAIGATVAWELGVDGNGIGVAVIDSGVSDVADLRDPETGKSRVVYSESFLTDNKNTNDEYGHGTHVAGIIASNGAGSYPGLYRNTFKGVAPKANIINLKVLDANGAGTDSMVIAAIDRAIELKSQYNIRIINLSLGRGVYDSYVDDPLDQAVEAAYRAGIIVVVAAGNQGRVNDADTHGYGTINAPGNDPYVITVGATKTEGTPSMLDDQMASYSSKGPTLIDHIVKPDIVAPGNRIVSLNAPNSTISTEYPSMQVFPTDSACVAMPGNCAGQAQYLTMSGTSMATPVVAGAAALLLQQDPTLTPDQIKARLMKTAWKGYPKSSVSYDASGMSYLIQYDIFTVGAGYLDVAAALNDTEKPVGIALSPTAVYDATTQQVSLSLQAASADALMGGADGSGIILWGSSLGGAQAVWGDEQLAPAPDGGDGIILWGSSVLGGNMADVPVDGDGIILWGSSVLGNLFEAPGEDVGIILWGSSILGGDTGTAPPDGEGIILWGSSINPLGGEN